MDMDTKLVLQMWRVQVMVNDHLRRRVDALERELGDVYVAQRTDMGGSFVPRRRNDSSGRRDADSSD